MIPDLGRIRQTLHDLMGPLTIDELPGIRVEHVRSCRELPLEPAVYFLKSLSLGLLYIGRATNLRSRWRTESYIDDATIINWDRCHAKHKEALDLGDVTLHWWAIDRELLGVVESILLQIHSPPWNNHRG